MAITTLNEATADHSSPHASKTKIIFIIFMFLLSLISFVTQTEFTSQAYQLGFSEPIILLLVTHGSWWILWPLQALTVSLIRTISKYRDQNRNGTHLGNSGYQRLNVNSQLLEENLSTRKQVNLFEYFKKALVKQFHNVYHTAILVYEGNVNHDERTENLDQLIAQNPHVSTSDSFIKCIDSFFKTPAIKYIVFKAFLVTLVLTIAGSTWYGAMSMTYAADVTAIYNCSAFTAYAFAIPLLHEKFSWLKASSVIIAVAGVFIVAYSGSTDDQPDESQYPYRFWGNLIILIGAVLYGYYEVLYKKYLCIPHHLAKIITPRRQSTFANFVMGFFGFFTSLIVITLVLFLELFQIHQFNFFNYGPKTGKIWGYIVGSIFSNLIFSASFLTLMALTSPVLSSVSSLLTIFLIGIVEWILFNNKLDAQQLLGDLLVVIGFVVLTVASWREISEGNEEDDVEAVSTYSFAVSTEEQS
ncbi:hypothetical protein DFJ63DRAFT_250196 [Scheffersomyces coipomensis]|uniref:uncharacterized protein n=1 Tax=Scheffersomyces coipomensis TaxID=1788519 RepID=UPI00315D427C